MDKELKWKIEQARMMAEQEIGFCVPDAIADEVLAYCLRKLKTIKKELDYLPLLYRYELPIKIEILSINSRSKETRKMLACEYCKQRIENGEEYVKFDGNVYHDDCFRENAYEILDEYDGYLTHHVCGDEEPDYDCYIDEVLYDRVS